MKTTLNKIASALAFLIGGIAVVAGGLVLLGQETDYLVINWLLLYNYTVGVLTVSLTAILIWTNNRLAMPARAGVPRSEGRGKMLSRLATLPSKEIL